MNRKKENNNESEANYLIPHHYQDYFAAPFLSEIFIFGRERNDSILLLEEGFPQQQK